MHMPPMPGVFPDYPAPVARIAAGEREIVMMRWECRHRRALADTRSRTPHWRAWLKPENRCLVPANSFAEYAPESNPITGKKDVVWFALYEDRPLFAFAGVWTEFKGD